jgi:hypothetical protein
MTTHNSGKTAAALTEPLEGQPAVKGTAVEPATPAEPAPTQTQEILYSKGDIAELVGMSTQALANRASRDDGFPKSTYTNASGTVQLYTKADIKAIHEFLTKPDRERIARMSAALNAL